MIALIRQNQSQTRLINNTKAKESIIKAFALADITNPNIDFVIETLFFSYSQEKHETVRKAALISLDILHKRSEALQIEEQSICAVENVSQL